jgi:hypothetical protein
MRTIDRAASFKRDYKREAKGQHRARHLKPDLLLIYRKTDTEEGGSRHRRDSMRERISAIKRSSTVTPGSSTLWPTSQPLA